jgi:asparagine synthase (glutamine-hydrolysing)
MGDMAELILGDARWDQAPADWRRRLADQGAPAAAAAARGEFAVGLPRQDGEICLAVDRFARRTLCWTEGPQGVRFAERADALGQAALDPQALLEYLFLHAIPSPRTIFHGVHRLPPGHVGQCRGGRMEVRPYAVPTFKPQQRPDFQSLKQEFRRLLAEAVQAELRPGIPACYLSGGTDSSTVAGQIRAVAGEVHTYSIGFDAEGYDELAYARIAARHFGARHHEYYVTPEDLVRHIPQVAASFDQPFGNSSALPSFCCALRAREDGVTRLLAGDGGDELFGGNSRYATHRLYGLWQGVPAVLRQGLVKPVLALPGTGGIALWRKGRHYVRDAEIPLPERIHHYNLLLRLGLDEVLEPGFSSTVEPAALERHQREVWELASADNELDRMLAYDWRYTLAESDLPKVRESARLAGIEVGFPFLSDALVDFSMRLPVSYKLKGLRLRWFFKEALRDFLPPEIITKQKKGFGLPFGVWAVRHAELGALAADSVRGFASRGVVRPAFVERLLKDHLPAHPGYYGEMVWILMMAEQWLRHHAPDWRFEAGRA